MLGAACPQTGQTVGLLSPTLNTQAINAFFVEFAKEVDPGVHVVMVWDQAGFHTAKAVELPENVTLLPLPPYSPELNPIENLWHYLKSHYWSNRAYAGYDALLQAAVQGWQDTCLDAEKVKAICACPYLEREVKT